MILDKYLKITMPDRSAWKVPIRVIAEHRAQYYVDKKEYDTLEESLREDTIPLFEDDEIEIEEWASNNMNWEDVEKYAEKIKGKEMTYEDFQEGWINGEKEIIEE